MAEDGVPRGTEAEATAGQAQASLQLGGGLAGPGPGPGERSGGCSRGDAGDAEGQPAAPPGSQLPRSRGGRGGCGEPSAEKQRQPTRRGGGRTGVGQPRQGPGGLPSCPHPPPARADQLTPSPGKSPAAEGVEHFRGATGLSADASRSLIRRRERRSASKMAMGSEAARKRLRGPPSLHHQQGWPFPGLRQPQHRLPLGIKDLAFPGFISSPSSLPAFFFSGLRGRGGERKEINIFLIKMHF